MWNDEAASFLLSRTMDHLGYGLPMVRFRQKAYQKLSDDEGNIAGSKAEGLTKWLESDADFLFVTAFFICTTNPLQFFNTMDNVSVFKLDMTDTAPGYTRLISVNSIRNENQECLFGPVSWNTYLSSDQWREWWKDYMITSNYMSFVTPSPQSKGPSNPVSIMNGYLFDDWDYVFGITCDCPELLQSWLDRPRKYSWPSADILREVSTMEAHVVPVGYKGSPLQFLEWRICFTKAEIKLIRSFNDCQIKLLILLKWLTKSCLKPICKEMTSYLMKNLVMWMVEKLPEQYFTENNLLNTLHITLRTLKYCVESKCLPSYMIPDRNLLADRLTVFESSEVCTMIDSLLEQGPQIVNRCEKIRDAFSMLCRSPEIFFSYTQWQLQTEITFLYMWPNYLEVIDERDLLRFILTIMPDVFELSLCGVNLGQIVQIYLDRLKIFMS